MKFLKKFGISALVFGVLLSSTIFYSYKVNASVNFGYDSVDSLSVVPHSVNEMCLGYYSYTHSYYYSQNVPSQNYTIYVSLWYNLENYDFDIFVTFPINNNYNIEVKRILVSYLDTNEPGAISVPSSIDYYTYEESSTSNYDTYQYDIQYTYDSGNYNWACLTFIATPDNLYNFRLKTYTNGINDDGIFLGYINDAYYLVIESFYYNESIDFEMDKFIINPPFQGPYYNDYYNYNNTNYIDTITPNTFFSTIANGFNSIFGLKLMGDITLGTLVFIPLAFIIVLGILKIWRNH